jgi:hypothetical protein
MEFGEAEATSDMVDTQIEDLVQKNIPVLTFANTQDKVVKSRYAYSAKSTTNLVPTLFPMNKWRQLKSTKTSVQKLKDYKRIDTMGPSTVSGSSAALDKKYQELENDYLSHGAVVENDEVISSSVFIADTFITTKPKN